MTVIFDPRNFVAKVSSIDNFTIIQSICAANHWRIVEQGKKTATIAFKSAITSKQDFDTLTQLITN